MALKPERTEKLRLEGKVLDLRKTEDEVLVEVVVDVVLIYSAEL